MTDPTPEAVRAKKLTTIQRLLDLAARDSTPEGEREAAMEKAMAMMAEHGVTEMMVDSHRRAQTDELATKTIKMTDPYSHEKRMLLGRIADALSCRALGTRSGRVITEVKLFGYRSDIERVELLYTSLLLQAVNGVRRTRPYSYATANETRQYRKSWLCGFAERVGDRLEAIEEAARRKYDREHEGETGTALVVVGRKNQVAKFYEDQTKNTKFVHSRRSYGDYGYGDGQRAGAQAHLGGGTGVGAGARAAIGR